MPSNFSRRSQRKRQTRLAFDKVEPRSPATISPVRVRYDASISRDKTFDLTSPAQTADDAESDQLPTSRNYTTVVETPKKQKRDGRIPFKPLETPVRFSQTYIESTNQNCEFA